MNIRDFAIGIVATPPSPATSGTTLTLQTGQGTDMPDAPFKALASDGTEMPTKYNSEILEVSDVSGDTLTFTREGGETTAKEIEEGWVIFNPILVDDVLGRNAVVREEVPTGAINGSNVSFTTSSEFIGGTTQVFVNGLKQLRGTHYQEVNNTSVELFEAPETGDNIQVGYLTSVNTAGNAHTIDGMSLNDIGNGIYPVGTIYHNEINPDNPSTYLLGMAGTTWEAIEGRVIAGHGANGIVAGGTGGQHEKTLSASEMPEHSHGSGSLSTNTTGSHNHSSGSLGTNGTGSHRHEMRSRSNGWDFGSASGRHMVQTSTGGSRTWEDGTDIIRDSGSHSHSISGNTGSDGSHSHSISGSTSNSGSGNSFSIWNPYYGAYVWRRTA